jgi:hypothetical protein
MFKQSMYCLYGLSCSSLFLFVKTRKEHCTQITYDNEHVLSYTSSPGNL